jgi:outer membrane protein OmpA-like peptidoglycan-associated protein
VPDPDDRCPAETGLVDRRGCPRLRDRDEDHVFDPDQVDIPPPGADRCPDLPGDPAYIGCPPPDSDRDGALDSTDKCPTRSEVWNGYQDDDGCPDDLPVDLTALSGTLRGINFAFMSATITAGSRPALDRAVAVFLEFPSVRVEISGHTDSTGALAYNHDLSRRRAESVKRYLVEHGIDAARIQTRGAGPDEPIDTNRSAAGRAKNRRIEFDLLVGR